MSTHRSFQEDSYPMSKCNLALQLKVFKTIIKHGDHAAGTVFVSFSDTRYFL